MQDDRINAIRALGEARQGLDEARAKGARRIADVEREVAATTSAAEREDVKKYNAALAAGWTADELKRIGYTEPEKTKRARRKSSTRRPAKKTEASNHEAPTDAHGAVDEPATGNAA